MIKNLIQEIQKKNAPIVVGLDPQLSFLPEKLLKASMEESGESLEAVAGAILAFNKAIIDETCDLIPAVKPQIAMYEQFGIPGLVAYKETVDYCHKKGLIVIGDIKRGDIGSTSEAYAKAHLGKIKVGKKTFAPFDEDFATVNPYLGSDGVKPFVDVCKENDRGIFVLVKTSNPSSGEFQDQKIGQEPLYEKVAAMVESWGEDTREGQYSNVGAVVGATYPKMGESFARRCLIPLFWFRVTAHRAAPVQTLQASLIRTDLELLLIHQEELLLHIRRMSIRSLERIILHRHPVQQWKIC